MKTKQVLVMTQLEHQTIAFSPRLNPPAEAQPHHWHATEHAAQVKGTRVSLQRRRQTRSYRL